MSIGWSIFLIILIVINIGGSIWLLWWTSRRRKIDNEANATTGHVWDGDLREYNKPLPRWWINLFYLTIVFAIAYFVLYPGFGSFKGSKGWSQVAQHDADKAQADAAFAKIYSEYANKSLDEIAASDKAVSVGRNLFTNNCAQCHGSAARGAAGFPNLVDADWQWGNQPEAILQTILNGRIAAMPPLAATIGDDAAITAVASYVQSLSGMRVDPGLAAQGRSKFELVCAACHGVNGKGNQALGAPNLTDDIWLYGSDIATIKHGIVNGRNGQMPAFEPILGDLRTKLVAGYVLSLGKADKKIQSDVAGGK